MTTVYLPNILQNLISDYIEIKFGSNTPNKKSSILEYLNKKKQDISNNLDLWDKYKKYGNPYEFIHTNIDGSKHGISKIKPLSRAYFKMIEICNEFDILKHNDSKEFKSFHLAEGPGGFIEAVRDLRKNSNDLYYGITLIDNEASAPGWNRSINFLNNNPNVIIEYGKTNNGDLFSLENIKYFYKKYSNKFDLVTGDGGFDFSNNYLNQEINVSRLILVQVIYAITIQKTNGCFVLKVFDLFSDISKDILYLLSCIYKFVNIYKPKSSRYANSEKYIICKYLKNIDKVRILAKLVRFFQSDKQIKRIFTVKLPYNFSCKINEANAIFAQQQIECINNTLNIIKYNNTKVNENYKKCIDWCIKYNIPFNNVLNKKNIFMKKNKMNNLFVNESCNKNSVLY